MTYFLRLYFLSRQSTIPIVVKKNTMATIAVTTAIVIASEIYIRVKYIRAFVCTGLLSTVTYLKLLTSIFPVISDDFVARFLVTDIAFSTILVLVTPN